MKTLIVIIGPTAIGKTALSIKVAQHFNCAIVSCDSRQFFKEMRIATAVPSAQELAAAPHYFIQNKSIFENYTVGDFEKEALQTLDELFQTNDFAVLVGGSGLYVDAILKGFDDFPEIEASVRESVLADYEASGIDYLQQQLKKLDPVYYQKIEAENPQTLRNPHRLMRFVEVCLATRKPYSSFLNLKKNSRNFTPVIIGLEADREVLYDRINRRVDLMIEEGLIEEARNLYPQRDKNALQTVGYRELFDYFDAKITLEVAIDEIKKNTRRFAKRQLTWFRRNEDAKWFNFEAPAEAVIRHINEKIN